MSLMFKAFLNHWLLLSCLLCLLSIHSYLYVPCILFSFHGLVHSPQPSDSSLKPVTALTLPSDSTKFKKKGLASEKDTDHF